MALENGTCLKPADAMDGGGGEQPEEKVERKCFWLQKFKLYETRSKFYIIGRDKNSTRWRVLKIDRLECSELIIDEDPVTYTKDECSELLGRIHEGNRSTGGLMLVTKCYGIVGFIKFLEPYYMILVTKRRQIGTICGHIVYGISESQIITVPHSTVLTNLSNSKDEQRYKRLLSTVDLTKDFFFSYTYHIMYSFQRNLTEGETGEMLYEKLFVWNEFLTRSLRKCLNNTCWTVALVYGFLKQAKIEINGKTFWLTLIARRSRHYAGTRYLKRGVNDKGRVANDVETEQIVFEDEPHGCPKQITSVVQNRGSIPLYWSQEASRLNLRPDIILHKKDSTYQATRLHFENLVKRYENPIIVWNLIKKHEKKPRESTLSAEFANAIEFINRDLPVENRLKYIHWDFHKAFRSKSLNVLAYLEEMADQALQLTGFYYSGITSDLKSDPKQAMVAQKVGVTEDCPMAEGDKPCTTIEDGISMNQSNSNTHRTLDSSGLVCENKPLFQKGVLRTNCIDCLDRTNVAQYSYGLAALGHQLFALGLIDVPKVDPDSSLGEALMGLYENMGDTLAFQYGGSAAHNKVFSERRGRWKATTHSQEFFRTLQRYYTNAYLDAEKQDAINVFLGHFQPQQGKPALWELASDQNCNIGHRVADFVNGDPGSSFKRSLSDGNILSPNATGVSTPVTSQSLRPKLTMTERSQVAEGTLSTLENVDCSVEETSYSRFRQSTTRRQLFNDCGRIRSQHYSGNAMEGGEQEAVEGSTNSHFNDFDWLASSGNSCEEDSGERCAMTTAFAINSSRNYRAKDTVEENELCIEYDQTSEGTNGTEESNEGSIKSEILGSNASEAKLALANFDQIEETIGEAIAQAAPAGFSSSFARWVHHGQTLCH